MRLYRVSTGYSEVSNESLSVLNESLGRGRGKMNNVLSLINVVGSKCDKSNVMKFIVGDGKYNCF